MIQRSMTICFLLLSALAMAAPVHGQTLQGHWDLDDGSGTTALDQSGNGHTGTLVGGATWGSGQVGGAAVFDGNNDRITIDSASFGFGGWTGMTAAAWVRNDLGATGSTDDIVGQWNYPNDPAWILTHHRNNQYFFELSGIGAVSGGTVSTNWTHVVATYDGATLRLYVDAVEVGSAAGSGPIASSLADVVIGSQDDGSNYFDGAIDEVRIYDGALSQAEVQALYDSAFDTTDPTLPTGLTHTSAGFTSITLEWNASSDPESGIDHYDVYRDGVKVGEANSNTYTDGGLTPATAYTYEVEAVNGQGLLSGLSNSHNVSTMTDTAAPTIISVDATADLIEVFFDETVESTTAEDAGNYSVNGGVSVTAASLAGDNRTVTLDVTGHVDGNSYDLTVTGVEDVYGNAMAGSTVGYTPVFVDPALEAHWLLDELSGSSAMDATVNANDGMVFGGAAFEDGIDGGSLRFDGVNDMVRVDSAPFGFSTWNELTVMAWVRNDVGGGSNTDDILSQWNYPGSRSWVLTHHRNGQYFFEVAGKSFVTGGSVSTNWTHVAATYDGSTIRLYVDGSLVDTQGGVSGNLQASTADIVIGSQDDGSNYFDGLIDDVRIYSRALGSSEVLDVYDDTVSVIASASPVIGGAPLEVQFSTEDPAGDIVSYAWDFGDGGTSTNANPQYTYTNTGNYTATVLATRAGGGTSTDSVEVVVASDAPVIDIWYGSPQNFGTQGSSQYFVNILGNVTSGVGLNTLTYSLNGGAGVPLTVGPDQRRLQEAGDFNIDLSLSNLINGANTVVITATDFSGTVTTESVTVNYDSTNLWPLPYAIDWTTSPILEEAVQIVDGKWSSNASGVRILEPGYDRVLSIGDVLWDNYEIEVPITVNDFTPGDLGPVSVSAGFGMTFRWTGHTNDPVVCPQPLCGWLPSGAGAWFDIGGTGSLYLDDLDDPSVSIGIGDTYIWKMRCETTPGVGALYSLKVWESSQSEPANWNLQSQRDLTDEPNGSIVLNLHHVDATIGNVTISDLNGPDTEPPTVLTVSAPNPTTVAVTFSEPVDQPTAETLGNYLIDQGIVVSGVTLEADNRRVTLTTSAHADGSTYTIDIAGVEDVAGNVMLADSRQYTFLSLAPILDLPFDEGTGLMAFDATGNGHDGDLLGGASWNSDPTRGTVVSLDGSNDRVAVDSTPLGMQTWSAISISAWVKHDVGAGAGVNDIVSWWRWTGWPCTDCSFVLTHHNNDEYRFEMGGASVSGGTVDNGWNHVVTTYDGATIRLYVNGVEVDSTAYAGGIPFSSTDLVIGSQGDNSNHFDGNIDDVILFDEALTPAQVLDLFNL